MTRPSKLFPGKMYMATVHISDAMVEVFSPDHNHPERIKAPALAYCAIEPNIPIMFLKRETKNYQNRNWGWTNPMPVERKRFFLFLVKEKVVCLEKAKLRLLRKFVYHHK